MARRPTRPTAPCLDPLPGHRTVHAWVNTGLDIHNDRLVGTRRCVWCGVEQHRLWPTPSTAHRSGRWRETRRPGTCPSCDAPTSGGYCSGICEDMDKHPAPRDDMTTMTTPTT